MTTYESKPVAKWNTRDFQAYLKAEHERLYGVPYVPFRGYQAEAGMLGRWVGTKRKPGEHGPELTKRFIDLCFAEYKPSLDYPGLSFGFMQTFMGRNLQRAASGQAAAQQRAERNEGVDNTWF